MLVRCGYCNIKSKLMDGTVFALKQGFLSSPCTADRRTSFSPKVTDTLHLFEKQNKQLYFTQV